MDDFLEIRCPSCDHTNLVARADVGVSGAWRNCQSCNARIFVSGEGDASGGSYVPQADSEAYGGEGLGIRVRMPTGKIETLSTESVEHGVQNGRILPWDLVSDDGQEFFPISEHLELKNLFLPVDFTVRIAPTCANHPDRAPAGSCRRCGRGYCTSCVETLIQVQPRLCPACGGAVQDPDPRLKARAPWEAPKELLRLPLEADAWKVTAAAGVLLWLASLSLFAWPLSLVALALFVEVAARASRGERSVAPPSDVKKLLESTLPVAILGLLMALPLLVIPFVVSPAASVLLQTPWSLFVLLYFPAAVGLVLVGVGLAKAASPRSVLSAIGALKEHYLLLILGLIAVSIAVVAVRVVLSFLPRVDGLLGSLALAYGGMIQAYLLGWTLYMNRERILAAVAV